MTPDELRDRIADAVYPFVRCAECSGGTWGAQKIDRMVARRAASTVLPVVREAIANELDAAAGGSWERTRARANRWRTAP